MEKQKRLGVALALYAVFGVLIWTTMSDVPVRITGGSISFRVLSLAVLAFFAVRTVLHWKAEQIRAEHEKEFPADVEALSRRERSGSLLPKS